MTNFKYKSYIPKQDIKVRPEALVNEIYNLFITEMENMYSEDNSNKIKLNYINYLYKQVKILLKNYHFWEKISSYNFCCYQFRNPKNEEHIGNICGRRIDKKNSYDNDSNKFLCSEHDRTHRKYHSKSIRLKDNEKYCNHVNKDGSNCKYSSKINSLCVKHYKYIYNINIEEIYKKIEKNIEFDKIYTNIANEIDLFNNIEIETFSQNKKYFHCGDRNSEIIKNIQELYIKENNNDLSSKDTSFKNKIIPDYSEISKEILNVFHRNSEQNSNNIINIEYKKCKTKNFNNCKNDNIIYNTYYKYHINYIPYQPLKSIFPLCMQLIFTINLYNNAIIYPIRHLLSNININFIKIHI
jgi:hypothetical protein